jgi:hypothetical protein
MRVIIIIMFKMKSRGRRTRLRTRTRIIRIRERRVNGIALRETEERTETKSETTKLMKRKTTKKIQKLITVNGIMNAS